MGRSGRLVGNLYSAHPSAIGMGISRLRALKGFHPPPYYFFGVADRNRSLHRFLLFPAYFDLRYLILVDSGLERIAAGVLLQDGVPFIKPTSIDVLRELASAHPLMSWMGNVRWRFLPDFVKFGARPCVSELCGFEPGANKFYHRFLDFKEQLAREDFRHYRFEVLKGWELPDSKTIPLDWDARLEMELMGEAK
jgi:hypothetical protein